MSPTSASLERVYVPESVCDDGAGLLVVHDDRNFLTLRQQMMLIGVTVRMEMMNLVILRVELRFVYTKRQLLLWSVDAHTPI